MEYNQLTPSIPALFGHSPSRRKRVSYRRGNTVEKELEKTEKTSEDKSFKPRLQFSFRFQKQRYSNWCSRFLLYSKGTKKKNDPAPNSHNRKRQPEARERQRSEKRDPTENPLQYHNSTITEETDNNTNVSVMSNTVAHNIPSFPIKLSFLAFLFLRSGTYIEIQMNTTFKQTGFFDYV